MTTHFVPSMLHPRFALRLGLLAISLLASSPGFALDAPSVEARVNAHGAVTSASQPSGPVAVANAGTHYAFGAWTDYGINRAHSNVTLSTSWDSPVAYGSANSKWTDVLTITTPDAAPGAAVSLMFSIALGGQLVAHEDDFTTAGAEVRFSMGLPTGDASWVTEPSYYLSVMPTPESTAGGDVHADVNQILMGELVAYNGVPFNLSASLDTSAKGGLMGPPGGMSAESSFYHSAMWLGSEVWIDGSPASTFAIASGSGFDYSTPAVPEPSAPMLLAAGLVLVWLVRRPGRRT